MAYSYYHVTEKQSVGDILKNGFLGGWGDWGYGVYLFNSIHDARDFAENHGWDGSLQHPVILEVQPRPGEAVQGEIHPEWPNPEKYETIFYIPLEDDSEDYWRPSKGRVVS